jgi:hypothetical protein
MRKAAGELGATDETGSALEEHIDRIDELLIEERLGEPGPAMENERSHTDDVERIERASGVVDGRGVR